MYIVALMESLAYTGVQTMQIGRWTIKPTHIGLLLAFAASLVFGVYRPDVARAAIVALQPICGQAKTISYAAATPTTAEQRFIAGEEWSSTTRFSYMRDLLTEGAIELYIECGEPSPFGRQAYGYYVDAPAAQRGAYSLVQPTGELIISTDKAQYTVGDTVIMTVTRKSGTFDRTIISGPFSPDLILDIADGNAVHTFQVTQPGANITVFAESGPQVAAQASFNVVAAPTATSTPVPPTSTPVPPTATPGPITSIQYGLLTSATFDSDLAAAVADKLANPSKTVTADGLPVVFDSAAKPAESCNELPSNGQNNVYMILRKASTYNVLSYPPDSTNPLATGQNVFVVNAGEQTGARAWLCADPTSSKPQYGLTEMAQMNAELREAVNILKTSPNQIVTANGLRVIVDDGSVPSQQSTCNAKAENPDDVYVVLRNGGNYDVIVYVGGAAAPAYKFSAPQGTTYVALANDKLGSRIFGCAFTTSLPYVGR